MRAALLPVMLVACVSGPRFLDDNTAELPVPVLVRTPALDAELPAGLHIQKTPTWGTARMMQALDGDPCASGQLYDVPALGFETPFERPLVPATNTASGHPLRFFMYGDEDPEYWFATAGWVRIDEHSDEVVRGAMSWVSEDEEGKVIAWGEGGFEVPNCEFDGG